MNPYVKKKLAARRPDAPGALTLQDYGALACDCVKRRRAAQGQQAGRRRHERREAPESSVYGGTSCKAERS